MPETRPQLCTRFHYASELIGRRWNGAIIFMLLKQTCRFATLRDGIPGITDRMLSERLQELEEEGWSSARRARDAGARRVLADEEREGPRGSGRFDCHLGREIHSAGSATRQARQENRSRHESRRAMMRT
jgi:hypothetical protein